MRVLGAERVDCGTLIGVVFLGAVIVSAFSSIFSSGSGTGTSATAFSASQAHACDKSAAKKVLVKMRPYTVASAVEEDGWLVVTFGQDYFSWSDRQTEGIVTAYANIDACITGQARSLEFRSPSGKLVARADSLRGIQMN